MAEKVSGQERQGRFSLGPTEFEVSVGQLGGYVYLESATRRLKHQTEVWG